MIVLHGFGAYFGLPEASPYVTKTEVQLHMAGLAYVKEFSDPQLSPKGQLPFVEDEGELISDSHFIRLHLERKYGIDFDEGLNPVERSQAWAIERMVENQLGWIMVRDRWLDQANFAKGPAQFFAQAPEAARAAIAAGVQEQVAANVRAVGVGRHADPEVLALGVRSLQALSALLGEKRFMMGDRPTGVDAVSFAVLAGMTTPYFDSALRQHALRYDNLTAYVDRMMAGAYPDHRWEPVRHTADGVAA